MSVGLPFKKHFVCGVLCRFICNTPEFWGSDWNRCLYRCEEAFWVLRDGGHISAGVTFGLFVRELLRHLPVPVVPSPQFLLRNFSRFKNQIPRCGGFIVNRSHPELCLLVRAWSSGSWFLPAGKVNQSETYLECARREIREETGLCLPEPARPDPFEFQNSWCRLYLFVWVVDPNDVDCTHTVRYEISEVAWLPMELLCKTRAV